MLRSAYSISGNVGNAYRSAHSCWCFTLSSVAVGYVLLLEKREEQKRRDLKEPEPFPQDCRLRRSLVDKLS